MAAIDSLNISYLDGILYEKAFKSTPIFNMLGGFASGTLEFIMGDEYGLGAASQPDISETATLSAPTPSFIQPTQNTNICQPFYEGLTMSYMAMSDLQHLTGLNIAGAANNMPSPLAKQLSWKMEQITRNIEYTIINGVYEKAATVDDSNRTRGLITAVSTNTVAASGAELDGDMIDELIGKIVVNSMYPVEELTLITNPINVRQLNKVIKQEGQKISAFAAGANIMEYLTAFGVVNIKVGGHPMCPAGTVLVANLGKCKAVLPQVEGKGNFFYEEKQQAGAAKGGIIFGQFGLDYGCEWLHGKITGLSTTYTADKGRKVFITNDATSPVITDEVSPASDYANILSFAIESLATTTVIDAEAHTVVSEVPNGTVLTALVAEFILSDGATAKIGTVPQVSGTTSNSFAAAVTYTVQSESGVEVEWVVTVTAAEA